MSLSLNKFLSTKARSSVTMNANVPKMKLVPNAALFVSEPNPYMFGNPANKPDENWTNSNWLKSRFHFSFAEYRDPKNNHFGKLRVMNDDLVQPARGFGRHPHSNMEIVTYIVDGELTHEDSTGNKESLGSGSVQFMTAGTGLYHSEQNDSLDKPVRFIQMWILPRHNGLDVNYASFKANEDGAVSKVNEWDHLVSDVDNKRYKTPVKINQDANIFVSKVTSGNQLRAAIGEGRIGYLLMVDSTSAVSANERTELLGVKHGADVETLDPVDIERVFMQKHDALKIWGPKDIIIKPKTSDNAACQVLLVEMAKEE